MRVFIVIRETSAPCRNRAISTEPHAASARATLGSPKGLLIKVCAMSKIGLVHNLWVLVCDGRKALLFQNAGDRVYPKLETREMLEHDAPATRELGTDGPGRFFSPADGRRSAA